MSSQAHHVGNIVGRGGPLLLEPVVRGHREALVLAVALGEAVEIVVLPTLTGILRASSWGREHSCWHSGCSMPKGLFMQFGPGSWLAWHLG